MSNSQAQSPLPPKKRYCFLAILILLGLTGVMFGDVLFFSKQTILSSPGSDIEWEFMHSRKFGFDALRQGHLALWNPGIYCGTPFLGGFQSALLYPPNILFLLLPLPQAINASIALHVFLLGLFMLFWTSARGLHPLACLVSSVLMMFCGAHFLHIYDGHLSNLCTMTWAPLLFLAIDGLLKERPFGACLLGLFAITMQILAGHPQYVFYTAVAGTIYFGLCLIRTREGGKAPKRLALFFGMFLGAAALGAVQLLPGIQAAGESARSGGVSLAFASMFSLPPANLVTLLAPDFFGDYSHFPYWGRQYLWETSLFVGVTGFLLALHAAMVVERAKRRFCASMIVILVLLALGANTCLFPLLRAWVPGFDRFRGSSKFLFQAALFLTMLAGMGLDQMLGSSKIPRKTLLVACAGGILIYTCALCLDYDATTNGLGLWPRIVRAISSTEELYFSPRAYTDPDFIGPAGTYAANSLMRAATMCLLFSALLLFKKFSNKAAVAIAFLAMIEIFFFARNSRATFELNAQRYPVIPKFASAISNDDRILYRELPNRVMSEGLLNIGGFDPSLSRRYAQFLAFTQGMDPDKADQYVPLARSHRLFAMLRCRYVFNRKADGLQAEEIPDIMPRLQLMQDYVVLSRPDQIFARMEDPTFDPRHTVILESEPDPQPVHSQDHGTAKVICSSTDHLTIEANLTQPAILLITDAYSKGWKARNEKGDQNRYELLPANYVLRAIPLAKGQHRLRVEYAPWGFLAGKWISLVFLIFYAGIGIRYLRRTSRTISVA